MRSLMFLILLASAPTFAQDVPADPAPAAEEPKAEDPKADPADPKADPADPKAEEPKAEEPKAKTDLSAVEVPATDEEAIEDVKSAVEALQTGQWATFVVLLLGLLGFGYNKFVGMRDAKAAEEPAASAAPEAEAEAKE